MAKVLCILTSPRKNGYTAQAYAAALDGVKAGGAEVDLVWLPKYKIQPCSSCFNCIRNETHVCSMNDDMGQKGQGELVHKVEEAHGLLIADPVYFWSITSRAHTFMERLYPFLWTGKVYGLPFGVISCASNQGMMQEATRQFCRIAYTLKLDWVDGLSVHVADFDNQLKQCEHLGRSMALAALRVEKEGIKEPGNQEITQKYMAYKWDPIYEYINNLTQGTFDWSTSLPNKALAEKRFNNPEAIALLEETVNHLKSMVEAWRLRDLQRCTEIFPHLTSAWTSATWKEFLEDNVIGTAKPRAYRSND